MKPRRQCKLCPWKLGTEPQEIPCGYDPDKHRALARTIARPGTVDLASELRLMACHRTPVGRELPCVGWLHHQLNEGDNVLLRYAVKLNCVDARYELVGPQHATFEDTLPAGARR